MAKNSIVGRQPPKKILFIIWSFSLGGGSEALLTTIVNHLDSHKYQIGIIEIIGSNIKREPVREGIKIYPCLMKADDPERKIKMYSFYHEWDIVIDKYIPKDYDLYISFNAQRPSFLLPPWKDNNIAWIDCSMLPYADVSKSEERQLQEIAFNKARTIVSISNKTTESLRQVFPDYSHKIIEIYNVVDVERIRHCSEVECDIRLLHPAVVFSGRLEGIKNPLRALDIIKRIHQKGEGIHLYYLGFGHLEDIIKEKTDELGLSDYVHFLGYIQNPFPIVKQADVMLVTSDYEGFGMNILEAQAIGIPFVSTDVGAAAFLAGDSKCGRLFSSNEEAVSHIIEYLNMDKGEIKRHCVESIKKYDLEGYIATIEGLIDEAL